MKITASHIELAVANHFNWRQNVIVPNISWGLNLHECDILVMSKSGFLTEVEIKISVTDLKKDFKKIHSHDGKGKIKYLYYAMPEKMTAREDIIALIPDHAGILRVGSSARDKAVFVCSRVRDAKARENARPLSAQEQFDMVRLGAMRIWGLKRKILMKAVS